MGRAAAGRRMRAGIAFSVVVFGATGGFGLPAAGAYDAAARTNGGSRHPPRAPPLSAGAAGPRPLSPRRSANAHHAGFPQTHPIFVCLDGIMGRVHPHHYLKSPQHFIVNPYQHDSYVSHMIYSRGNGDQVCYNTDNL